MRPRLPGRAATFAALLVPAVLTVAAVVLLGRLAAAVEFALGGGRMLSCSVGVSGISVSCEMRDAIWFAFGGLVAAAITACATRLISGADARPSAEADTDPAAGTGVAPTHRLRDELLIAASGPLLVLQLGGGLVLAYFGVFWGGFWSWAPGDLLRLLVPYLAACAIGTLGFWAVLHQLSRWCAGRSLPR